MKKSKQKLRHLINIPLALALTPIILGAVNYTLAEQQRQERLKEFEKRLLKAINQAPRKATIYANEVTGEIRIVKP